MTELIQINLGKTTRVRAPVNKPMCFSPLRDLELNTKFNLF